MKYLLNNYPLRTHAEKVKNSSTDSSIKLKKMSTALRKILNIIELNSIYHHPPQPKDTLNIKDSLHNLSIDINRNSIKNKNNCFIEINGKILENYMHNWDVKHDKSQGITRREPVDKFIDHLVEGIKTSLSKSNSTQISTLL